nr:unnamed protein product [Spirometra erinaceieuropaei]
MKRKTGTVIREVADHDVDIAAPSQTHFSEQIQLKHVSASHTLLCSGHPKAERRNIGVVFVIWNVIVGRLLCLPQCINDCPFGELKSPTSSMPAYPQRLALTGHNHGDDDYHLFCSSHRREYSQRTSTPTISTPPSMQPRTHHDLVVIAPSHPTSAFSVNYESIAQRLTNRCSDHRNTPVVIASTLRIKPEPSTIT